MLIGEIFCETEAFIEICKKEKERKFFYLATSFFSVLVKKMWIDLLIENGANISVLLVLR